MADTWYVIARKDNGYPLTVYADKERAEHVARANGEVVVPVVAAEQIERLIAIVKCCVDLVPPDESLEVNERVADEMERLRDFVVSQPCECYTEYGKRKPEPCERCRLTHGHETWIEFEQAADAAGGGDDN